MNRLLKLKQTENCKVWLSSDWHYNHNPPWNNPIWKQRGYNSVDEMNHSIIKSINATVRYSDILIYMGDMVLNCQENQFENFLSQINCQQIYVLFGNHNSCVWSIYEREVHNQFGLKDVEIYPFKYRNLIYVGNYLEFSVDGHFCCASHYPIWSFNGQHKGCYHFFGHIHSTPTIKTNLTGRKMDVGFDYWKQPISFNDARIFLDKIIIFLAYLI